MQTCVVREQGQQEARTSTIATPGKMPTTRQLTEMHKPLGQSQSWAPPEI